MDLPLKYKEEPLSNEEIEKIFKKLENKNWRRNNGSTN